MRELIPKGEETVKLILKIFAMTLGFCILLVSIIVLTAPDSRGPNAPPESVAIGMLAAGIILLGWPTYTFVKVGTPKKVWEFTLEDGKHTVELERGSWSHKKTVTVDGMEIMRSGWYWGAVEPVVHFELGGVPCVLDPIHLWVRGKLLGGEKALRETVGQAQKVRKTEGYGQEQKAGVFRKIKDAFTSDFATQAREALLWHLRSLGVEVEYFDERVNMAKLAGQSIDGVIIFQTANTEIPDCAHYVVFGMRAELASRLKAKSKEVKEDKLRGKVRNVRWVGGPLARLLNSDADLLQLQIEEGQTKIEIRPDKTNQWVRIAIPAPGWGKWVVRVTPVPGFPGVISEQLPSRQTLDLCNTIVKHIRNYMAQ